MGAKPRTAAIVTMLITAVFVIATSAQTQQGPQSDAGNPSTRLPRTYPAPINLKVLPKSLSGQQVHDIMEQWAGELNVRCKACHAEQPDNLVPGGTARLKFADDSRPMKDVARLMYTMTEEINNNFIAKVKGSGQPVTCGTCHRGRICPEPFAAPPQEKPSSAQTVSSPQERP